MDGVYIVGKAKGTKVLAFTDARTFFSMMDPKIFEALSPLEQEIAYHEICEDYELNLKVKLAILDIVENEGEI